MPSPHTCSGIITRSVLALSIFTLVTGILRSSSESRRKKDCGVILRPGPYVCAEWDFGGYPSYLLKSPSATVRSNDARYMAAAQRYISALAKEVRPLLVTHGGPILMVQVE